MILTRCVTGFQIDRYGPPDVPFGWRRWRLYHRRAWLIMPLWVYLPLCLWEKRWTPVAWLIDHGVLQCNEGDYYRNARPLWLYRAVWCFLHDADRAP
jgi:hypothetical protein